MIFTSFSFLIFICLVLTCHYLVPANYRWVVLLTASYIFYFSIKPVFVILLLFTSCIAYFLALAIDFTQRENRKKVYFITSLTLVLLPLLFFKYLGNLSEAMMYLLSLVNISLSFPRLGLLLPIGISFYTFVAIGYTVDVYNGDIKPEKNLGKFALFISFFPLILSGPIERAKNILPQLNSPIVFNYALASQGLKFIIWGYFSKLVVADRIALYVNAVFSNLSMHNGNSIAFASFLYPFQVYADLGGYSLIAIGSANLLGLGIIQNFKRPFFATSVSEFWRRWHMSLISWLTDYVFIPICFIFRKYKKWGIVIALMITFFISGIWHGAKLTFIVWGLMQGVFLSYEALTINKRDVLIEKYMLASKTWFRLLCYVFTFLLFTVSQIVARVANLQDAFFVYYKILTSRGPLFIGTIAYFIYMLFGLAILLCKDIKDEFFVSKYYLLLSRYRLLRTIAYASIIILILMIGVFDAGQFIYFQF